MADTKEDVVEVDMDLTLSSLRRAMRELAFHASAATGAEHGMMDCLNDEEADDADLVIWAQRVSATHQAVAEMAHIVAVEANTLGDICTPRTPSEEH